MGTRMLQRRGDAAEWAALNPILGDGELGFVRDTLEIKIGDGVTAWNDLGHGHVNRDGDTMTGNLAINPAGNPAILSLGDGQIAKSPGVGFEFNSDVGVGPNDAPVVLRVSDGHISKQPGSGFVLDSVFTATEVFEGPNRVYSPGHPQPTASDPTRVAKAGDSMTGSLAVVNGPAGIVLNPGDGVHSGYLELFLPDGTRVCYIGSVDPTNKNIIYANEQGGRHVFNTGLSVSGTINDADGRVYSPGNLPPTDTSRVAKAGDTLSGRFILDGRSKTGQDYSNSMFEIQGDSDGYPRLVLNAPGVDAVQLRYNSLSDALEVVNAVGDNFDSLKAARIDGTSVYDNGNRVYSASNPPPGGGGSSINQTARGTISFGGGGASATATITTVNMAKSQLRHMGATSTSTSALTGRDETRVELTNATTITAYCGSSTNNNPTVGYELTEWT